jgi:hypothetical protein
VWSPDGQRMLFAVRTADLWSLVRVSPGSGLAPDTLARFSTGGVVFDPVGYLDDTTAIAQDWNRSLVARFNPREQAATMDTFLTGAALRASRPAAD